ncbi:hypothetical protein DFJ43DRAFT_1064421 [Lentinula guzmanii]|uniref:Uncharacterized protein n=1 Tax=Lentinula guzmanii TaxID=2804957 RepID=A0AA38JKA4_9AGAR|nr:hypothetical protein DFJ43DRAFT_1064421 [Lentinula guzmanii]
MLFGISYVLLSLIAVIHAIPVDSGITYSSGQTVPPHPPHADSLSDPRHPQPQPQSPKDKIYIKFQLPETGTGCPPIIKKEITLIFEEYRQHLNVSKPFEILFEDRYDGSINHNFHDFWFLGEGVGKDCHIEKPGPCEVEYDYDISSSTRDPSRRLATIYTSTKAHVFDVTYAIRNRVLSERVHPVSDEILAPLD